jgi:hypothetical protein
MFLFVGLKLFLQLYFGFRKAIFKSALCVQTVVSSQYLKNSFAHVPTFSVPL